MSIKLIQDAFMTDFAAMTLTGVAKVYPNIAYAGTKPYASLQFIHSSATPVSLTGGKTVYEGFVLFTVVTELGIGLEAAATVAGLIAARYPYGKLVTVTGGWLQIPSPPYVVDGFRQDKDWRTPIRVPYLGHF